MKDNYTKEKLESIVKISTSLSQVLVKLGLVARGGNFEILKSRLKNFEINTSHFKGNGWRKGQSFTTKTQKLDDILKKNSKYRSGSPYQSNKVKGFLFKNNLKERKCENCNLQHWMGQEISFELHHKDGDKYNNEISNLEILCPNCHCLTDNYRGKNINKEEPN